MINIEANTKGKGVAVNSTVDGNMVDITMEIAAILKHFYKQCPLEFKCAIEFLLDKNQEEKWLN